MKAPWLVTASLLAIFSPFLHAQALAESNFKVEDIVEVVTDLDTPKAGKATTSVVILSEGYRERQDFMPKARGLAKQLRDNATTAVMREVTNFDFYFVWVPSKAAGAPWRNGKKPVDTPFQAHVQKDGSLATDDSAADRAMKFVLRGTTHEAICVYLIHLNPNDPKAGSATDVDDPNTSHEDVRDNADTPEDIFKKLEKNDSCEKGAHQIGRVRQVDLDVRAFVHEFGHARFGLDDEYWNEEDSVIPASEKGAVAQYPNTTTDPSGEKWRKLVPGLFSSSGKIKSIVEGGSGYAKGVWHAEKNCRMNQTRNQYFCSVCEASIRNWPNDKGSLPKPSWVAPKDGSKPAVVQAGTAKLIELSWKPGAGDPPLSWLVELVGADGRVKWSDHFEGHLRAGDMKAPKPGIYTLRLTGQRLAKANDDNRSPPAEIKFRVLSNPTIVIREETRGITDALTTGEPD